MLLYCLICWKKTDNSCKVNSCNPTVVKTNEGKLIILSDCGVSDSKKLRFIKEQEASELSSSLGIKTRFRENSYSSRFCFIGIKWMKEKISFY